MIPHAFEPDPAQDVRIFTVQGVRVLDVEVAADQAGVPVTVVDGEYVALVPCAIGFLRYAATVPTGEQVPV